MSSDELCECVVTIPIRHDGLYQPGDRLRVGNTDEWLRVVAIRDASHLDVVSESRTL